MTSDPRLNRTRLLHRVETWLAGGPIEPVLTVLRRKRLDTAVTAALQQLLAPRHHYLPSDLLDPQLLPAELLLEPESWTPTNSALNLEALQAAWPELNDPDALLRSGLLARILQGEGSLYPDLPPIDIRAYWSGLRRVHRQICRERNLCALEHLAGPGYRCFQRSQPLGPGMDRYQPYSPPPSSPTMHEGHSRRPLHWLVVLHDSYASTAEPSVGGDWDRILPLRLDRLEHLLPLLPEADDALISFCHSTDQLCENTCSQLTSTLERSPDADLITSDELIRWSLDPTVPAGNPQLRVQPTPFRLLSRGGIGGLITLRRGALRGLQWPQKRTCQHNLMVDLALQLAARTPRFSHCEQPLIIRDIRRNPSVLDVGSPWERQVFRADQSEELLQITRQRGAPLLCRGGSIDADPSRSGCHQLRFQPREDVLVSVLIPFRDRVERTRVCVESWRRYAGAIPYELILIDNGSREGETLRWLDRQRALPNVRVVRLDMPFNYARLHNLARPHCRGSHLLLLNNDLEFQSPNVLEALMAPLAFRGTKAVGARLTYPDGSLQHQGVRLIRGERRCLQEPGKHLACTELIQTLTPLVVQEEFSAASAACLLMPIEVFDRVGGFDEAFSVVFNDVDLCLRLRDCGGSIVVTPHVRITHHESISRGKDTDGVALARHLREQGRLRCKHAHLYADGDPLTSGRLHPHSAQYQPRDPDTPPLGPVQERVVYHWRRRSIRPGRPLLLFAHFDAKQRIRPDLFDLLRAYQKHAEIVFISSSNRLHVQPLTMLRLKRRCASVIIRCNEGYDFGSWMTGLRLHANEISNADSVILANDSFWGPVTPLEDLFWRIEACDGDVVGLTDNLMYEPHLQSAFLVYRPAALESAVFREFWNNLQIWEHKRDLVKHCEVGLTAALRRAGLRMESLFSKNANGNILHFDWKELIIQQHFPFIKVSLLRDNPTNQPIDDWEEVVGHRNPKLARQIRQQLRAAE